MAVADPAELTAAAAVGDAPDDDEYDALLADVTEVRTQLVALIASLTDAGVIEPVEE